MYLSFGLVIGYSLAFSEGNAWIGGLGNVFMNSIKLETASGTIPESLFATFQMTFAIITPALMIGAFVERIKSVGGRQSELSFHRKSIK